MCELNCRVEGEELYRSVAQVVDGTSCDAMSNDVCVDGVCQVRCHVTFSAESTSAGSNSPKLLT